MTKFYKITNFTPIKFVIYFKKIKYSFNKS